MAILLLFAFVSGLVTIFAPCIWPLLPIVLSSTVTGEKNKPLGITLGILISFTFFTLTLSYIVKIIPFDPNVLRLFAVLVIGFLGLILVVPKLSQVLEGYVSRISGKFAGSTKTKKSGFLGGLITGVALGIVWTPCAGPILATIATLAATTSVNFQIILVTIAYVIGIGIPLFIFATFGNYFFSKSRVLTKYTGVIQQVFGVIMILTAIAIFTNYDKVLQVKLLNFFPSYSDFLIKLENNPAVKNQLSVLRGNKTTTDDMPFPEAKLQLLRDYGQAPEFVGISNWLNSEPLTLKNLRGKVVLVDFWTYTCINCIRTLSHITEWDKKYRDMGLVIVGVHTPEFEFEKNTTNVEGAIKQYNIEYPVAQDNDYATWRAYDNHYWPAKYLIDAKGTIRYIHFGEGEYENTEKAIQALIKEAGKEVNTTIESETVLQYRNYQTPETYLGLQRMDRFASNEQATLGTKEYSLPLTIPEHYFGFEGSWYVDNEFSSSLTNSVLQLNFIANKVFLVITPKSNNGNIKVYLDGKVVDASTAGADVKNGYVQLNGARLYHLINLFEDTTSHLLKLEFQTPEIKVFAFTFG